MIRFLTVSMVVFLACLLIVTMTNSPTARLTEFTRTAQIDAEVRNFVLHPINEGPKLSDSQWREITAFFSLSTLVHSPNVMANFNSDREKWAYVAQVYESYTPASYCIVEVRFHATNQ